MTRLTARGRALLEVVHDRPGITRADAARELGIGTGTATELVVRLAEAGLVAETPAAPSGSRGRPTTVLGAHPAGPVVLAASIAHESWRVAAMQLGNVPFASFAGRHDGRDGQQVIADVAAAAARLRRRLRGRVRGLGISAPGTVLDGRWLDASYLGWQALDLTGVWPRAELLIADNDATAAAVAESRRGAAVGARFALHVHLAAGIGGAVVAHGQVIGGARGVAGEFGHLPFGDRSVSCPCGARGCWGTALDGIAMARRLGGPAPRDPVTYARRVLARAAAGDSRPLEVVNEVAAELGRGLAGLVNGLDPDLVTMGGLAVDVLQLAGGSLRAAYGAGLMSYRREPPVALVAARLGEDGPLIGVAEQVWNRLWDRLEL